jgi:glycosyltransferase involved in cell wall biosynthesis
LRGADGLQAKELEKLVAFLETDFRPDVVLLTNVLLSGLIPELSRRLRVPVIPTLQGDDIFLDALPAVARDECLALIRRNCADVPVVLATSSYYADHMANYAGLPRERIRVAYPGLNLAGHGIHTRPQNPVPVIGYYARICPEKGFHVLVDAYILLRKFGGPAYPLLASGWLGESNRAFYADQVKKLEAAGFAGDFSYTPTPDHAGKVRFFSSIDLLSVPTTYREPKGLYVLEAWANGVPVLLPRHGTFPELIAAGGGGELHEPNDPAALAAHLAALLEDAPQRRELGRRGREAVETRFHAGQMAADVATILQTVLPAKAA